MTTTIEPGTYDRVVKYRKYTVGDRVGLACYCDSDFYGEERRSYLRGMALPPFAITDDAGTYFSYCGGDR